MRAWDRRELIAAGLNDHLRNRVGCVIDVLRVQGGDANASAFDRIDRVFRAQPLDLLSREARVREHATLPDHEAEVRIRADGSYFIDELVTHSLDALAHLTELGLPERAQLRRAQHGCYRLRTVRGRARVIR